MDLDIEKQFRDEIRVRGLWVSNYHLPAFVFDLNSGEIRSLPDPTSIMKVVLLARKYAESSTYGNHVALLNLVAYTRDFGKQSVLWYRPYHIHDRSPKISLRAWLERNGKRPRSVYCVSALDRRLYNRNIERLARELM